VTSEPTAFLYPFIDGDERDAASLLTDLAVSARAKVAASARLRADTLTRSRGEIAAAGAAMAERFARGGRLYAFGNGGSATDADAAVARFRHPASGVALPAASLVEDRAVLTALANDVGVEVVFARQVIAHGRPGDIALAVSTSGGSPNVLAGLAEARRRGLLTVGLCGYDGGPMASSGDVAHCIVVRSDSVHRIQEAQDAVLLTLWAEVQAALPAGRQA
jgi:D-sedoheptulose 7-phosphate isomerase